MTITCDHNTKTGRRQANQRPEIDVGLAAMCLHRRPRQTFTCREIAEVCGVGRSTISELERAAKRSLRKAILKTGLYQQL